MERLTSYKNETSREMICKYEDCDVCEEYCPHMQEDNCSCLQEVLEKLGQYEDAEEQGLLLRLPCKVGDTVWEVEGEITECVVTNFGFYECGSLYCKYRAKNGLFEAKRCLDRFGEILFLTKEEAEQKLAEMKKE